MIGPRLLWGQVQYTVWLVHTTTNRIVVVFLAGLRLVVFFKRAPSLFCCSSSVRVETHRPITSSQMFAYEFLSSGEYKKPHADTDTRMCTHTHTHTHTHSHKNTQTPTLLCLCQLLTLKCLTSCHSPCHCFQSIAEKVTLHTHTHTHRHTQTPTHTHRHRHTHTDLWRSLSTNS